MLDQILQPTHHPLLRAWSLPLPLHEGTLHHHVEYPAELLPGEQCGGQGFELAVEQGELGRRDVGVSYHVAEEALANHRLPHGSALPGAVGEDDEGSPDCHDLAEETVLHGGDPLVLELVVDDCRQEVEDDEVADY